MSTFPNWCLLIMLLVLGHHAAHAYTNLSESDSLRTALLTSTDDAERVALMNELSSQLKNISQRQALIYAQQALESSRQIDNKEQEIKALYNIGLLLYDGSSRDSALFYFETGERIAEASGFGTLQADHLMKIAKWYRYRAQDSIQTVKHLLKSVAVSKAANYHYGTGRSYAKLASFYTRHKEISLCEKYLERSAEYYMRIENGTKEIAHYYNEVGNKIWDYNPKISMDFYFKGLEYMDSYPNLNVSLGKAHSKIGKPEIALKYLEAAITDYYDEEHYRLLGTTKALLAEVHIQLNDYEAADKICEEGIAFLMPLSKSTQKALPMLYRIKGQIQKHNGNNEAALKYYTKSLDEANRLKNRFERIQSYLTLGEFYTTQDIKKAKEYCRKSLKDARKNSYTNIEIAACQCLHNIYKKEKSYRKALKYYEQKTILIDSLGTLKVEHALDINSKLSQKDKQLAEQAYQKEIRDEQFKNQYRLNTTLIIATCFGLLLIGFLTMSIRRISNQNKEIIKKTDELESTNLSLARSNEELERFAHVASHDLKTPLHSIIGFTGILRRKLQAEKDPIINDSLNFIENSGKRMRQLIEDVLEYSKLSSQNTLKKQQEIITLNELVDEIAQLIQTTPNSKPVNIETSQLPNIKWSYSKIFLLFKNIIENGIKYNQSEHPAIKIHSTHAAGTHTIHIQDNGIGIEQQYFDKIFLMFNRLHSEREYEGTGLGLATCKKIVDEFDGKITIESAIGKGTTFKIELPSHLIHTS